jgi:copper resistance protein C
MRLHRGELAVMRPRWIPAAAVLAVLSGAALGWAGMSGVALAHDELVASTPVDGQALAAAPAMVELEFAGDVQSLGDGTAVVVTEVGADDVVVSTGRPTVDGAFVRQRLVPDLPDAEYLVAYRVISSDGHEVEGTTRFYVGSVPPVVETVPPGVATDQDPAGRVPTWVVVGAGLLVVVVVATYVVRRGRRRGEAL